MQKMACAGKKKKQPRNDEDKDFYQYWKDKYHKNKFTVDSFICISCFGIGIILSNHLIK